MNKDEIIQLLAIKIRTQLNKTYNQTTSQIDSDFSKLKEIASLTVELLNSEKIKYIYINQLKKKDPNKLSISCKIDTFKMIRNILVHFPIFDNWDQIEISRETMNWNKGYSSIVCYFDKYANTTVSYDIYTRYNYDNTWTKTKTVSFTVPALNEKNTIFLKDFISLEDAMWTFTLIDSLLDYFGLPVPEQTHFSM